MLGSKTQTIIGRPIVPEAVVHAIVEEHVSNHLSFLVSIEMHGRYLHLNLYTRGGLLYLISVLWNRHCIAVPEILSNSQLSSVSSDNLFVVKLLLFVHRNKTCMKAILDRLRSKICLLTISLLVFLKIFFSL